MKQVDIPYTDAMDRLVLLAVGTILVQYSESENRTALLLGLLRKLVQSCLELAGDDEASGETESDYTWEEKIESLVKLAKIVGRYTHAEPGTDYYTDARRKLFDAYETFCEWRHDEPYVVDEIKSLIEGVQ